MNFLRSKDECRCKVTLISDEEFKTNPQLGYWYAVVVPTAAVGYRSAGYNDINDEKADFLLRKNLYSETIFDSNGCAVTYPMSLSDASKEDMSALIDNAITFIADNLGMEVPENINR